MNVKPTLNEADIKLLTKTFATKDNLKAFATRIEERFDDMDTALVKYSQDIETRVQRLENVAGILAVN